MRTGELARSADMKVSAVRYYERAGLLPDPSRTTTGYRDYGDDAVRRLAFIRRAKEVGFSLKEIRALLARTPGTARARAELSVLIDHKLGDLRARRSTLQGVERELMAIRARLNGSAELRGLGIETLAIRLFMDKGATKVSSKVPGWFLAGSRRDCYEIGIAAQDNYEGKPVADLRSTTDPTGGFGTVMQQIGPDEFAGKRVRFSGAVRPEGLKTWAGLWMRVDGPSGILAFDNMSKRPILGTSDWSRHTVVLDVGEGATNIAFGVLLEDEGCVRIADLAFEVVDPTVPSTSRAGPTRPVNLDFADAQEVSGPAP